MTSTDSAMAHRAATGTAADDWEAAGQLSDPWSAIWAEATASFAVAENLVWNVVDPALADLCRCRIAMLLGERTPQPRAGLGEAHERQVAELALWPTSPLFGDTERASLAFTEQFVMDVGSMAPALVEPVSAALGDGTFTFVQALYLLDAGVRMGMILPRLFGTVATGAAGAADVSPAGTDGGDLWATITEMLRVVACMQSLDTVTTELVRLRGARFHNCRICQSRLSLSALEAVGDRAVLDQVDVYESSDLPERQKVALRLTDAMVTQPSGLDDTLVASVRAHFTPAQAIEIVYDVARNATNKFAVALGVDAAAVDEGYELFDVDDTGNVVAAVEADELRRLLAAAPA
jgi:alkylhydroperoxidase family enzyme